jgi:hypothetical protein
MIIKLYSFISFFIAISILNGFSQTSYCNFQVNAGIDTSLCQGTLLQLNGSTTADSILNVSWQPSSGLSDSTILNPFVTVNSTTSYFLNITGLAELIYNGDFSAGDTGFTTGYVPGTGGISGIISNQGEYDINTNPHNSHIDFATFGDHTTGTGNMIVINGSDNFNVPVWCQSFPVAPFSSYNFSAWFRTCNWQNPAILQFAIDGIIIGSNFYLTSDTTVWVQFTYSWNSDTNTTAGICITDLSTWSAGNDFAIDDISFTGLCTQADSVTITMLPPPPAPLISQNGDTLSTTPGLFSYQWFLDSIPLGNATNYYCIAQQSGNYYLMITDTNGCSAYSSVIKITTGINEIQSWQVEVYPNPAGNILNIRIPEIDVNKFSLIKIFSIDSKIIFIQPHAGNNNIIRVNLEGLPSGFYFLQLMNAENKIIMNSKFIR